MSQPTPGSPSAAGPGRQSFPRWVRATSERHLLVAAQREVARRHGLAAPGPRGVDLFWQRVFAPVFHALPYALRARVAGAMPGSHRRTWHTPAQVKGPAV